MCADQVDLVARFEATRDRYGQSTERLGLRDKSRATGLHWLVSHDVRLFSFWSVFPYEGIWETGQGTRTESE